MYRHSSTVGIPCRLIHSAIHPCAIEPSPPTRDPVFSRSTIEVPGPCPSLANHGLRWGVAKVILAYQTRQSSRSSVKLAEQLPGPRLDWTERCMQPCPPTVPRVGLLGLREAKKTGSGIVLGARPLARFPGSFSGKTGKAQLPHLSGWAATGGATQQRSEMPYLARRWPASRGRAPDMQQPFSQASVAWPGCEGGRRLHLYDCPDAGRPSLGSKAAPSAMGLAWQHAHDS